ncbi:unnamed protein product [Linum trigynum]|uniref:Uncharacterized protein n=1 Tax=Linum trigynum TaxID=586398 RepID=A0AAV2DX59_9ROSI
MLLIITKEWLAQWNQYMLKYHPSGIESHLSASLSCDTTSVVIEPPALPATTGGCDSDQCKAQFVATPTSPSSVVVEESVSAATVRDEPPAQPAALRNVGVEDVLV